MDDLLSQITSVLASTPMRWNQLTNSLSSELLNRPPAPGEWSALECLHHLIDTEQGVFPARVQAFLVGKDFEAFHPEEDGTKPSQDQTPAQLAKIFESIRKNSLALVAKVNHADLQRTAKHSELGLVTLEEQLNEWAAHDLMHTVQAEQALMQPFIAGCGPWKVYFKAHMIG